MAIINAVFPLCGSIPSVLCEEFCLLITTNYVLEIQISSSSNQLWNISEVAPSNQRHYKRPAKLKVTQEIKQWKKSKNQTSSLWFMFPTVFKKISMSLGWCLSWDKFQSLKFTLKINRNNTKQSFHLTTSSFQQFHTQFVFVRICINDGIPLILSMKNSADQNQ